ncbi:MAG: SEC-C domain-containing protein [Chloroflexi bacterium]|nr:SEC-C domain-containing protein [Chloroflexota bacterium]MBU1749016.1 SEC-C domain-containing protein [Chloroflexota bacterium]
MAKLGTKKHPIIVRVQTQQKAIEVAAICQERGWHYIAGIEPDKPEDLSDLERLLNPVARVKPDRSELMARVPGRNSPCPCGSGKRYKRCCGAKK